MGCFTAATTTTQELDLWELKGSNCWIKCSITLPEELQVRCNIESLSTIGNLPTGEILLTNPNPNPNINDNDDSNFTSIYSYDHSTIKFQRFEVGKFPCTITGESFQISCLELNNGDPLKVLLRKPPIAALQYMEEYMREETLADKLRRILIEKKKKKKSFKNTSMKTQMSLFSKYIILF